MIVTVVGGPLDGKTFAYEEPPRFLILADPIDEPARWDDDKPSDDDELRIRVTHYNVRRTRNGRYLAFHPTVNP